MHKKFIFLLVSILTSTAFAAEDVSEKWFERGKRAARKIQATDKKDCSYQLERVFALYADKSNGLLKHGDKSVARLIFEKEDGSKGVWLNVVYEKSKVVGYTTVELAKGFGLIFNREKGVGVTAPGCHHIIPYDEPTTAHSMEQPK